MINVSTAYIKQDCGLVINEVVKKNRKLKNNIGVTCAALMCVVLLAGCTFTDKDTESEYGVAKQEHTVNVEKTTTSEIIDKIEETDSYDSMSVLLDQERIIQTQSFTVELNDWGIVEFISYKPIRGIDLYDVSFYLMKDNQVIYEFPYYFEGNNSGNYFGLFYDVDAVGFRDLNNDGKNDIIIIISYVKGVGPEGAVPHPTVRIFLDEGNEFCLAEDMILDISENINESDLSIENVYQFIQNTN